VSAGNYPVLVCGYFQLSGQPEDASRLEIELLSCAEAFEKRNELRGLSRMTNELLSHRQTEGPAKPAVRIRTTQKGD
jgi:hypothetical protein